MRLRLIHVGIIVAAVFTAGISLAMASGFWSTHGSGMPATFKDGELSGQYDPGDIRGSHSFGQLSALFKIPLTALTGAFGVEASDGDTFLCKGIEALYGKVQSVSTVAGVSIEEGEIGTDSVRYFISLYSGLPYVPEKDTLLPFAALHVLREKEGVPVKDIPKERIIAMPLEGTESSQMESDETCTDMSVKGYTTFGDLYTWGVSGEEIEKITGFPAGDSKTSIKDYLLERGVKFSTVKEELQKAVDRK